MDSQNSQNSWKAFNAYNNSYRVNKDSMAQLTARLNAEFLKREYNFDKIGNTSLYKEVEKNNSSVKRTIRTPINLDTDILRYKKHERDDSSDSSLQIPSSDNSLSTTSTRISTPVDDLDSKFEYMKAGLSPPYTDTKSIFNELQHKEILEQLRKEHQIHLNKIKLDYEKSKNDQKEEFEKIIRELRDNLECMKRENQSGIDKLRKELTNQNKDNEKKIEKELTTRFELQEKELTKLHDIEKNKLIAGLMTVKRYKEKAEDELIVNKNNFQVEIRSLRKEYEKSLEKLRGEHATQLDSLKRGETKLTFKQVINQQERIKREGEMELRKQMDELMNELSEKKVAEASWIKYKREKETTLLDLRNRFDSSETTNKRKDAQIAKLQEEYARSLQKINDLNRNKERTNNMIKEFQQKTEEVIKEQLNAKVKIERESGQIIETLREQLNDANKELSNLRTQISSLELEFNESKERCEDFENLAKDKSSIIRQLQLQLERKSEELVSMDAQSLKLKERQEKELEQAITSLRKKLETNHQKELQEFRDRLEKEYEIKKRELFDQNLKLKQNSVQNSKNLEELEEATRCLAKAESSYKELSAKHQQLIHENQQLSNEIGVVHSRIKDLEANNLDLKENNKLIMSENEKTVEDLKKAKDEMKRLQDENSTISNKKIELKNERDKLANTVSTMESHWEENQKDLQNQLQEMVSQKDKLVNELTKIKSEFSEKVKTFEELANQKEIVENQKESLSKLLEEHQNGMQTFIRENAAEREAWKKKETDLASNYEFELGEKCSKIEELRDKLDHTMKHVEELEKLLQNSRETETNQFEISQKLEAALQECVNKDNEISNLEMFKKQSRARIDSLESSTNRLTAKLREFETDAERAKRNADAKISDFQNRLRDSLAEIENLHNQVSDLKQKLIEKEAMVLNHSRSSSRDGPTTDSSKLTNLTMQVEEHKAINKNLESQIATLTQKLQELHQEKSSTMRSFENSITQAEKTADELHNRIKIMNIEHEKEKKELKKQHEGEIAKITEIAQSRLIVLERSITNSAERFRNDDSKKVDILKQQLSNSHSECEKLNEKIMHVQQKYADSISERDRVMKERNDMEKRVKCLDEELKVVLAKNIDLVTKMSKYK